MYNYFCYTSSVRIYRGGSGFLLRVGFIIWKKITVRGLKGPPPGKVFSCNLRHIHPACRVYFALHPARYEPVSTYLGPHSRRTHVPLLRQPPSLDIKANRKAPAIRRHCLAWEIQAKWQYTGSDAKTWPTLFQHCDSVDANGPTLRQHCVLAICEMLFVTLYAKRCENLANAVPTLWQRRC